MPDVLSQTQSVRWKPLQWEVPKSRLPGAPRQWHACGTIVLVASGPSLTRADVAYCRGRDRVMVVNDAWQYAIWADALYAGDHEWWSHHKGVPKFQGQRWGSIPVPGGKIPRNEAELYVRSVDQWGLFWVWGDWRHGLSSDPTLIHYGGNSGYQALNLAVLFGIRRILLLGYDMQDLDGRSHFFGEHPHPLRRWSDYKSWTDAYRTMVPDLVRAKVEVINCSRETALDCFPRAKLRDVL